MHTCYATRFSIKNNVKPIILTLIIIAELMIIGWLLGKINFSTSLATFIAIFPKSNKIICKKPLFGIQYEEKDDILGYKLIPNFKGYDDGSLCRYPPVLIKINSYGFRDYEYNLSKNPYVFRIAIVGDSMEFGPGVPLNYTYPKILERILNNNCNRKFEVLNFGVPGYSIKQKVLLINHVVNKFDPDLIIVGYTTDDIINYTRFNIEVQKALRKSKDYNEFIKKYQEFFRNEYESEYNNNKSYVCSTLRAILSKIKTAKKTKIMIFYRITYKDVHELCLRKISEDLGFDFFSTKGLFELTENLRVHPLDAHPNIEGHKRLAEILYYSYLRNYLNRNNISVCK